MKWMKEKKKWLIAGVAALVVTVAGCGEQTPPAENQIPDLPQESSVPQTVTEEKISETTVLLYYGNKSADGLVTEEASLPELTAEALVKALAGKNIVSLDTKVRGFQRVEKEQEVILDLNLSKEFAEYVGMMGTAGEYIVMAGLTNTFLDAFGGTSLVLNVNGMPLETGHNIYDTPLVRYPMTNEDTEVTYQLTEEKIEEENFHITYPQFAGMENQALMERWNAVFREQAAGTYTRQGLKDLTVTYEVMTQDVDILSVVFRGSYLYENAAYPVAFAKTINIDLRTGESLRLSQFSDVDEIVSAIQSGTGCTVLTEGIAKEDFQAYMNNSYSDDFAILLFDYDYDSTNKNLIPTGYSYILENKPVLVVNVMHAMGDYVEIQLDTFAEIPASR